MDRDSILLLVPAPGSLVALAKVEGFVSTSVVDVVVLVAVLEVLAVAVASTRKMNQCIFAFFIIN